MIRVYLDWNIISYLRHFKATKEPYISLNDKLVKNTDKVLIPYTSAHLTDLVSSYTAEIAKDIAVLATKITDPETQKAVNQADKAWNASIEKLEAANLKINNELKVKISRLLTAGYIYSLMKLRYENVKEALDLYLLREANKLAGY